MPKIKIDIRIEKRFKISKNGKVLRAHTNKRHILNSAIKSTKRKRNLRKNTVADKTNVAAIKKMIPYK